MHLNYIKLHLNYLYEIENGVEKDNFPYCSSIYEHMHAYFLTLGLGENEAWKIIDDFRQTFS